MSSDVATVVYSYFFVASALLAAMGVVARYFIKKENQELKQQLDKIMYALYNDGKTGLINKVELLLENQQDIKIDVEVLKAMGEK